MVKKWLTVLVLFVASVGPLTALDSGTDSRLVGPVTVTDGDSLRMGAKRMRLFGIDAPELSQTCRTEQRVKWACGRYVAEKLRDMLANRIVTCQPLDRDRYGRTVARCLVEGSDIGAWMVESGYALAYQKYSQDYLPAELRAEKADLGLWAGAVQTPAAYRLAAQLDTPPPSPKCAIKGNISKSGRIYHLPGSKWYTKTKIDPRAGERWFCTVAEAVKAGWRAPRK